MRPSRPSSKPAVKKPAPEGERLQKVLAAAGHGSRRACEELIAEGRVEVAGKVVTQLGTRVDLHTQEVRVDGVPLKAPRHVYYMLNKPMGVVTTSRDPSGRARVIDLLPDSQRLFAVGRLDRSSEGLILVTNDGELANRLAHPRYEVPKVYQAEVMGSPEPKELEQLTKGLHLAEGFVQATEVKIRRRRRDSSTLEITLREGRNREIRRMLARIGHKVLRLKRIALGPLRLGELPTGAYREVLPEEIKELRAASKAEAETTKKHRPRRSAAQSRKLGARPGGPNRPGASAAKSKPSGFKPGPRRAEAKKKDSKGLAGPRVGRVIGDESGGASRPRRKGKK